MSRDIAIKQLEDILVSGAQTLEAGEQYFLDASSTYQLDLPPSPDVADLIRFSVLQSGGIITFDGNGNDINGGAAIVFDTRAFMEDAAGNGVFYWTGLEWRALFSLKPQFNVTNVSTSPYTILLTDEFVAVDTSIAITLNLPPALAALLTKKEYTISDVAANAGANNIELLRDGADVIIDQEAGQTSTTIGTDGGTIRMRAISASAWKVY